MPDESTVATVINDVKTVANDVTKSTSSIKVISLLVLVGILVFAVLKGCNLISIGLPKPTVVNGVSSVKVSTDTVTYTVNGKKTKVYKPIESVPSIVNNKLTIPHFGLCLEPFIGYSLTSSDSFRPYLSFRVIYWNQAGLQLGLNDRRSFIGLDYRLPIVNLLTISAGESISYTLSPEPYIALNAQISL